MKVEQIYTNCLAQGSYYIESNGEAAVVDPLRDVSKYIELANKNNAKIKYVFETHLHADFISGHLTLAKITDATIVYGPEADINFSCRIAEDNQIFNIGNITLTVLHTPGHTLESSCFLLKNEIGKEYCLFSGDTLFLGDVGRPDLAQKQMGLTTQELAGILYDSINNKIKPLSEDILIYPGHGAGSQCGKNMMKETVDTLGNQKNINYVFSDALVKDDFIKQLTDDLPEPPAYFSSNVKLNKDGYQDISLILEKSNKPLSVEEFDAISKEKEVVIIDARHQDDFAKTHIPNSIFIGLDGDFAPWAGEVISDIKQPILLVVDKNREKEAIIRLSRVGFDNVIGYLDGEVSIWKDANKEVANVATITAKDFEERQKLNKLNVFDVRRNTEYLSEHIIDANSTPLNNIKNHFDKFNLNIDNYIHCAGGYRSMVANSILKSKGIHNLIDIQGGFSSIKKTNIATIEYSTF